MFMTRDEFLSHPELLDARRFFVMRDLRDTLVSLYFSLKVSHPLDDTGKKQLERDTLQSLSVEDGFLHLIARHARRLAAIQGSWVDRGEIVLRYEDLLQDDVAMIRDLLENRLKMRVASSRIAYAVKRRRCEAVFKRKLGSEDISSHGRKGLPGDWKNQFTPAVRDAFRQRYGDLLIATGYERDHTWAEA
jgi:lipopolysaccharide transport system ATP-binding protein